MPRPKNPIPTYRLHRASGQAVVSVPLPLPDGTRRDVYLGAHGSDESKGEYARVLARLRATPPGADPTRLAGGTPADLTLNELLVRFLAHADRYYVRADGTPTSEAGNFRHALKFARVLYGYAPCPEFGPLALKAVRESMVAAGLCRPLVNCCVNRVRRVFKWAAGEELIPFESYHRLTAVAGLPKGRSAAREPAPVGPVPDGVLEATLPYLPPRVAAMARLQSLTGMRPGEVCAMAAGSIDASGAVRLYRPGRHKTAHRGKARVVPLGPQAQAVLAPFVNSAASPDAPLFRPAAGRAERYAKLRSARKSRVQPSQS